MQATRMYTLALGIFPRAVELDVMHRPGSRFELIGFGERVLRESPLRVRHAWRSTGRPWPAGKWIIGLSPSGVPKSGASYDLPLALGIALAQRADPSIRIWAMGELHVDGRVLPVPGASHLIHLGKMAHADWIVLPMVEPQNRIEDERICYVESLDQALRWLDSVLHAPSARPKPIAEALPVVTRDFRAFEQLADIPKMQWLAMLAAHGRHHMVVGAHLDTDWTLLPKAIHELRVLGHEDTGVVEVPLRMPKGILSLSTAQGAGMESLVEEMHRSHGGVLALGRWHEQETRLDDRLDAAMEQGVVAVGKGADSWLLPAVFQLVLATSLCPCGAIGHCICRSHKVQAHRVRFRKVWVDKIDVATQWAGDDSFGALSVEEAMERLHGARRLRRIRSNLEGFETAYNRDIPLHRMLECGHVNKSALEWLEKKDSLKKVPRSRLAHLLRTARSLADLHGSQTIEMEHVKQSLTWNDVFE